MAMQDRTCTEGMRPLSLLLLGTLVLAHAGAGRPVAAAASAAEEQAMQAAKDAALESSSTSVTNMERTLLMAGEFLIHPPPLAPGSTYAATPTTAL